VANLSVTELLLPVDVRREARNEADEEGEPITVHYVSAFRMGDRKEVGLAVAVPGHDQEVPEELEDDIVGAMVQASYLRGLDGEPVGDDEVEPSDIVCGWPGEDCDRQSTVELWIPMMEAWTPVCSKHGYGFFMPEEVRQIIEKHEAAT